MAAGDGAPAEARLPFASTAWLRRLGEAVVALVAADPRPGTGTFSEEYVNVPEELLPRQGVLGWFVEVRGADVRFEPVPRRDADAVLVVDFAFARSHLLEISPGDERARERRRDEERRALADGRVVVLGDLRAAPRQLVGLHDAMAAVTEQPGAVPSHGGEWP